MAHSMMACLGLPVIYVWADFTCNQPHLLKIVKWQLDPLRGQVAGSGTPFLLVRKTDQRPFDDVFGPSTRATSKGGDVR